MGRQILALDRQHLLEMVADPVFYEHCPAFVWLRDAAVATKQVVDSAKTRMCCGKAWSMMRPHVDGFVRNLRQLHQLNPELVQCVKDYLCVKKGYRPDKVLVFYRPTAKEALVKFQF